MGPKLWSIGLVFTAALLASGCRGAGAPEITGPFTGTTYRFVVDQLLGPNSLGQFGDDLDGNGSVDNGLPQVATQAAVADMIASGALASYVEITSDDPMLGDDPTVGVRYLGANGLAADMMGASLAGGMLISNRTRTTRHPAFAVIALPILPHADPTMLPAASVEIELMSDGMGFSGEVDGVVRYSVALPRYFDSFIQAIDSIPGRSFAQFIDSDGDGHLSLSELESSIYALFADVKEFDDNGHWHPDPDGTPHDSVSFGFGIHLTRCDSGDCALGTPVDHCDDRARDGDETDVDCGGSCDPCPGGSHCIANGDCETAGCERGGVCAPASCTDGVLDGYESDIDCGDGCSRCADGRKCVADIDCASGNCCAAGTCGPAGTDC